MSVYEQGEINMDHFFLFEESEGCMIYKIETKCLQHHVFPGGHPSKYLHGSTVLNFSDQTRTGVFNMIWPQTFEEASFSQLTKIIRDGNAKCLQHHVFPGGHPSKY